MEERYKSYLKSEFKKHFANVAELVENVQYNSTKHSKTAKVNAENASMETNSKKYFDKQLYQLYLMCLNAREEIPSNAYDKNITF